MLASSSQYSWPRYSMSGNSLSDRLAETLFSLVGRRNARLDVDDEDLARTADLLCQTPRRQPPALDIVRRHIPKLNI